jgi:hypothetical protein
MLTFLNGLEKGTKKTNREIRMAMQRQPENGNVTKYAINKGLQDLVQKNLITRIQIGNQSYFCSKDGTVEGTMSEIRISLPVDPKSEIPYQYVSERYERNAHDRMMDVQKGMMDVHEKFHRMITNANSNQKSSEADSKEEIDADDDDKETLEDIWAV